VKHKTTSNILVLGGGVAGIAASVKLASAGYRVTLLEKGPRLGGRAYSFYDAATGEWVDNCQHILMGCCEALKELYRLSGSEDKITWQDTYYFYYPNKGFQTLKSSCLPAPFQLLPSFLKLDALSFRDRINITQLMSRILSQDPEVHPEWATLSIKEWFESQGVSRESIGLFWEPVLVSALNDSIDQLPVSYVFKTIRWGFLGREGAWKMGIPSVSFHHLYHEQTLNYLTKRNSLVRLKEGVKKLVIQNNRITGVLLSEGSYLEADTVISALPQDKLVPLLDADSGIKKNMSHYQFSPIMGIHIWLDRRIMELPNLCLPGNFIQWIFDKTPGDAVSKASSQYLSIVISASQESLHLPQKEIIDRTLQELKKVFPAAQDACRVHSLIIREPRATFKLMELQDSYRLGPVSDISGLYLAGDWTDTGWPATMESAALSGFAAARQVINREPL